VGKQAGDNCGKFVFRMQSLLNLKIQMENSLKMNWEKRSGIGKAKGYIKQAQ